MNIAVLNTQIPFCVGGAEVLAEDLLEALALRGHNATLVTVPFKWYPQQSLIDSIFACKLLDIEEFNGVKIDKVIALRFPLWLVEHTNKPCGYYISIVQLMTYGILNLTIWRLCLMASGLET